MTDFKSLREKQTVDEVLEEVVAARKVGDSPQEMFGGPRDWIDSAAPTAAFMIVLSALRIFEVSNSDALRIGIYCALAAEAVVVGIRLVRKETLRHAFSGVFGLLIAIAIVWKTQDARNLVLPGIFVNGFYCVLFLLSVVFRRPLVAVVMRLISDKPKEYHDHPTVRRAYTEATLIWAFAFGLRVVIQESLRRSAPDWVVLLSKLILGYPLFALVIATTVAFVKWRTKDVPVPESAPADEQPEPGGEDATAEAP